MRELNTAASTATMAGKAVRQVLLLIFTLTCLNACAVSQPTAATPVGQMDTTIGTYGEGREQRLILVTVVNPLHRQLISNAEDGTALEDETRLPPAYRKLLQRFQQRYGLTRVADWPLDTLNVRCLVFESDGTRPVVDLVAALAGEPEVETAQPVQMFAARSDTYNDPYLPLQHSIQRARVDLSHQWSTGAGVRVAIIDTGIDHQHTDIANSIKDTANFVDNNDRQFMADHHGTAVAGIISATANNATGMVGIAPDAHIMAMKACWTVSGDNGATCNSYTLAKALNVAIRKGADIINLSLSGPRDPLLERLVDTAVSRNITVIGARDPVENDNFPAGMINVIAAGLPGDSAAVSAPGRRIISTAPSNQYDFYTGSSFSTAHLSGLVALIRQLQPDITLTEIRQLMSDSASTPDGEINFCKAIASLLGNNAACTANT